MNFCFNTVFPSFLTGPRYHTVTHRDRDLTSVQRPEMINTNSFGIVTVTFMDGHGVVTEPSQKRWKYCNKYSNF